MFSREFLAGDFVRIRVCSGQRESVQGLGTASYVYAQRKTGHKGNAIPTIDIRARFKIVG